MISPLAISSTAATVLGAYNVGRFLRDKAREKIAARRREAERDAVMDTLVKYGKTAYSALSDGLDDEERAKVAATAAAVKAEIANIKQVKKPTDV